MCEYKCAIVLAKFDDAAISKIKQFLQKDFDPEIILPSEMVEQYLGQYATSERNFQFMNGHKKWFEIIS